MIGVLNFKPWQSSNIRGFFDLRYHGMTIKGCRLMSGVGGYWIAFPQKSSTDADGTVKYFDQICLAKPEMDHVRRLIVAELEMQGHIEHAKGPPSKPRPAPSPKAAGGFRHPDTGEDLSEYVTDPNDDSIPF